MRTYLCSTYYSEEHQEPTSTSVIFLLEEDMVYGAFEDGRYRRRVLGWRPSRLKQNLRILGQKCRDRVGPPTLRPDGY